MVDELYPGEQVRIEPIDEADAREWNRCALQMAREQSKWTVIRKYEEVNKYAIRIERCPNCSNMHEWTVEKEILYRLGIPSMEEVW